MEDNGMEISLDGAHGSTSIDQLLQENTAERGHLAADANPYKAHGAADDAAYSFDEGDEDAMGGMHADRQEVAQADLHGDMEREPDEGGEAAEETKRKRGVISAGVESIKYLYSVGLLVFCVVVVMASMFTSQTGAATYGIPPVASFFIFWFLILWLAMMEGGQGCLVGLQPVDKDQYAESHPISLKNTTMAHRGDNMERFIVGRQFLVVLVIFLINMCGAATSGAAVFGFPQVVNDIFLASGVALMITTIVIGQLTAQVNAAVCMLDFINNYFMLFTSYVSLFIEFTGLLHSVYLVQIMFSKISRKPIESDEPPRNVIQNIFFWTRVLMSLAILGFALAVTLKALFDGNTTMWKGVPPAVSVVIFFLLLCVVGMMEGMQIAAFALLKMPNEELAQSAVAHANCTLMFAGQNLQAFLIGRQIFVASCMFIVARISTLSITPGQGNNVFGVSDGLQNFFNTGLLGAVVLTIIGSLAWRIVASSFPLAFMSNPVIYVIIRVCLLLEYSGICSASWVLARLQKPIAGYEPDEVYLEGAEPHGAEPVTRRDKDIDRLLTIIKYTYSLALLVFCVVIVMACIFTSQTGAAATYGIHPAASFFIFWFLIVWLAMMEGGQGCLVGLQPVDKDKYEESHPVTFKNTSLAHKGDNMERFIVGRQFLVVLVIFLINMCGASIGGAKVLGLPDVVTEIFLASGVAMMITTIVIGQLTSQVTAAVCMLDFINSYFMLFTSYVSLFIELSGLLHSVYLVQIVFSKITRQPIETKEDSRNAVQNAFFWTRVLMSLAILGFAMAVTIKALFDGKTTMWDGVPPAVSVVIFFVLLFVVGMMEGMQIAAFTLLKMPEEELEQSAIAHANCTLMFHGHNLQAFLIGRQIFVASCMFIVARISTLNVAIGEGNNVFGVSDGLQNFFNTGLLGAVVLTIIGSLAWRIIASSFPLAFMSNPLIYIIIRICLLLEATGICSASWVLARWHKAIVGYQPDEVYLEGAERHTSAPNNKREKDIDITVTVIKYLYSTALVVFCVVIVMASIFTSQTGAAASYNIPPVASFFIFWFLIIWLAMMEGGQGCLVGLQPVDKSRYADSHPVTLKNTALAHKGDNMERFIVGRQFLVVLVIFLINMCGAAIPGAKVLNLPDIVTEIFLGSGVAMMITTIVLGQLTSQVNAANCMLDFINNYFMLFTSYVSLFIELTGLLHSVYLVQIIFSKITGQEIETKEDPRNAIKNAFFWTRVLMSLAILGFALAVTLKALFDGNTTMWDGVPPAVSVVIFFVLLFVVGMMEGMQIAAFALLKKSEEELAQSAIAHANCTLMFHGHNLQAFLIGRQIFVASCMFIVARISTLNIAVGEGSNVFGVSDGLQNFFNTGLLGAVVLTIIGSLAWRIIASSFPLAFMSNPLIYIIIRICLVLEAIGICSASWLFALIHKAIAGYQVDEAYLGTEDDQKKVGNGAENPSEQRVENDNSSRSSISCSD